MMKKAISILLIMVICASLFIVPVSAEDIIPFTDVQYGTWYYDAVVWGYTKGLFAGTSDITFSPNKNVNRGMFITVLWRYAGCPVEEPQSTTFRDLDPNDYYYDAAVWSLNHDICFGLDGGYFKGNRIVTREEATYFLYKYSTNILKAPKTTAKLDTFTFSDASKVSSWAIESMAWANADGIIVGTSNTTLNPKMDLTRAQLTVVLYRVEKTKNCLVAGHNWKTASETKVTCTEDGYKTVKCSKCGSRVTTKTGSATGHVYDAKTVDDKYLASKETCTAAASYYYNCRYCGKKGTKTFTNGSALGHDYVVAVVTHEANGAGQNTKYKLKCSRCSATSKEKTLGYPQRGNTPARDAMTGITYPLKASSGTATVEVSRRWFGSAYVYIAHITLPSGTYSKWTSGDAQVVNGVTQTKTVDVYAKSIGAIFAINGDANNGGIEGSDSNGKSNIWVHARNGKFYGNDLVRGWASYWNYKNGSFGMCEDLGNKSIKTLVDNGKITDTMCFWGGALVRNGRINVKYDASASRRQRTFVGFKKDSNGTVHVYACVCDGWTGVGSATSATYSNDGASYGMTSYEEAVLLSSLGCTYGAGLDGGHSSAMYFKGRDKTGKSVSGVLNADDYAVPGGNGSRYTARPVWDFLYFK